MKFCDSCGTELKDGADICLGCGKAIKRANIFSPKTENKMAVTGLIVVICSFYFDLFGAVGLVGLICSIAGLIYAKKNNGDGKVFAIIGLILGIISVISKISTVLIFISSL